MLIREAFVSCARLSHAHLFELEAYSDLDSLQEELQKIGIYLVGIGCHHTVRKARIDLQTCSYEYFHSFQARGSNRNNLIIIAVHDQDRYINLLQIVGEVNFRDCCEER